MRVMSTFGCRMVLDWKLALVCYPGEVMTDMDYSIYPAGFYDVKPWPCALSTFHQIQYLDRTIPLFLLIPSFSVSDHHPCLPHTLCTNSTRIAIEWFKAGLGQIRDAT